ncbi:glycosyltransferase [Colwellia sp. KU-HH00111]|uniref:glycosyltransferase family 2 protein n=1 Tax=Colwellia sp. KU-HH00111 TaxID=3127652 RepID=UPI0031073588
MNNNPKISVILPMYNAEDHIQQAVDSILNQTYDNFELIIINDGSTDRSLETISQLYSNNEKVKIFDQTNHGLIYTLNKAIDIADGELIARMDADDISFPDRFLKQVQLFQKQPTIGICGTSTQNFGFNNDISIKPESDSKLKVQLLISPPFAHPSIMVKRAILINNNIKYNEQYKHCEDYAMWTDLAKHCDFSNVADVLLKYRVHEAQVTNMHSETVMEAHYRLCCKNLRKLNIDLLKEDFLSYIGHEAPKKGMQYLLNFYDTMLKNNEHMNCFNQLALQELIQNLLVIQIKSFSGVKGLLFIKNYSPNLLPKIQIKLIYLAIRRDLVKTIRRK